jgi:cell division protein FtsI (penicillin-binding protein 3)
LLKKIKKVKNTKVISKKTAKQITSILVDAVENGTGTNARVANFTIAGKTSTAQKVSPTGGYSGYISGFIGFPVNVKRRFITYVYVDDPKGQYYGNQVAAPIFKNITRAILYKNKNESLKSLASNQKDNMDHIAINQSATIKMGGEVMPSLIGLDKKSAEKYLEKNSNNYVLKGFGIVKRQVPSVGEKISINTPITLYLAPPQYE